ncbi:hypothetical protein [Patulibacter defluvii]|uniref:hypothetical protein n=1 Tax=Patulibacter defluvii TaxID=3095358 RepID=UPI002A752717|nr:hypothetical protein [Patulibacter sp. DM4]
MSLPIASVLRSAAAALVGRREGPAGARPAGLGRCSGATFAALADSFAAPAAPLPAATGTGLRGDARRWLAATPPGQRLAVRIALVGLELLGRLAAPRVGFAAASRTARLAQIDRLGRIVPPLEAALDALGRMAVLAYWSDPAVRAALARVDAEQDAAKEPT